jgi:hypothetical protein
MKRYAYNYNVLIGVLLIICLLAGCADSESNDKDEFFIRVGDSVVTVFEFNSAFEISKAAYPYSAMQNPADIRDARLRLFYQMTEEMIIQERAKELGIKVSDSEVEKAVSDIKGDYPDDVFEQTLLENAVPYHSWKEGLKTRLLMEKVVAKELGEQIEITPEDISKYYEEHYKDDSLTSDLKEVSKDINVSIMKHLRMEKMEDAYKPWIKKLQKKYTIEINKAQLEKITGSKTNN